MGQFAESQRCTDRIKAGVEEKKCTWVLFPGTQSYLLPVIARHNRIVPVFDEDGGVTPNVIAHDPALADMADKFLLDMAAMDTKGDISVTVNVYGSFMRLVRALILTNYDRSDVEIADMLTMTNGQLPTFWSRIVLHLSAQ